MLVTPRTYRLSQTPDKGLPLARQNHPVFRTLRGWAVVPAEHTRAAQMLLIHQVGSVHVGEVVRYVLYMLVLRRQLTYGRLRQIHPHLHSIRRPHPPYPVRALCQSKKYLCASTACGIPAWSVHDPCFVPPVYVRPKPQVRRSRCGGRSAV